ncbi:hypothetical protein HY68_01650 [Streptomyces sp. AcH 505]|uniref:hypothetical protein n=1 Tax=Streptomyces sp. AcH 505 TaxID=352211 RepID=UPI0005923A66|nr:hypothetical protein HY68_01650 [Streptomyces sp. AcH 505]
MARKTADKPTPTPKAETPAAPADEGAAATDPGASTPDADAGSTPSPTDPDDAAPDPSATPEPSTPDDSDSDEPPCAEHFPQGWPATATAVGCEHGNWARTLDAS